MEKYVTVNDVFFVEDKIKSLKYYPTPNQLWKELKGRFKTKGELGGILEYFQNEKMLILDKGKIVWLDNPKLLNLIYKRGFTIL